MNDLIPKPRRVMRQPTKDTLRQRIADQAQELERLREINLRLTRPWWKRITRKSA